MIVCMCVPRERTSRDSRLLMYMYVYVCRASVQAATPDMYMYAYVYVRLANERVAMPNSRVYVCTCMRVCAPRESNETRIRTIRVSRYV